MENINKRNADRLRNSDDVVTGMRVQGPAVAADVAALLFEGGAPRKVTIAEMFELFADALQRESDQLRRADAAHLAETSSDAEARSRRDRAFGTLRDTAAASAKAVTVAYDAETARAMGLDLVWASRPDLLITQVRNAIVLARRTRPAGATRAGVRIDVAELAREMERDCAALEAALEGVKREERAAQATLQARETALAAWERVYPGVAELFTGLCLMSGRVELAARVKPTVRKARGEASPSEPPPNGEPSTPAT